VYGYHMVVPSKTFFNINFCQVLDMIICHLAFAKTFVNINLYREVFLYVIIIRKPLQKYNRLGFLHYIFQVKEKEDDQ
jgi:hypothetical protein